MTAAIWGPRKAGARSANKNALVDARSEIRRGRLLLIGVTDELENFWEGEYRFVPHGAEIVFPKETVQGLFEHTHPGSTRKTMTKHSPGMVIGWEVGEVTEALYTYDPDRAWPRTKGARTRTQPQRKDGGRKPRDRRK